MRGYLIRSVSLGFMFSALALSALAGGFGQPYQSARVMGLAGCATGFQMGAASAFYNPGAMSFLEYSTITAGLAFTTKNGSYLSPYGGNTDQDKKLLAPLHVYGVLKLNDEKSAIGLSVNKPFGFYTQWPDDWTGRYLVTESSFSAYFIQPSFSYKFGDNFSAGIGPVIAFGNRLLSRKLNAANLDGTEAMQEFDGNATGFGVNVGLYYEVEEEFAVGLTFRSPVKMKTSGGSVNFSNVPDALTAVYPSGLSYDSDLNLPMTISAGASYMPIRELLLTVGFDYTGWSSTDDTEFEVADAPDLGYQSGWTMDNTITFRVGSEYELNDKLSVRAGVALDGSPLADEEVTPELPDADRFIGALGVTVHFSESFSADLSFLTENTREREVYNPTIAFGGTYKSIFNHFGFTVNVDF